MKRTLIIIAALIVLNGAPAAAHHDTVVFERFGQRAETTKFQDDYGFARRGHRHRGNDIFGEKGDPVVAVAGGIVKRVATHRTAGHYVVIEHIGGWETWYLHLNNDSPGTDNGRLQAEHAIGPRIEEGWYVPAGSIIGFVGDSGNAESTEPHTHFELHIGGSQVNPYPYLIAVWTLEQEAKERSGDIH